MKAGFVGKKEKRMQQVRSRLKSVPTKVIQQSESHDNVFEIGSKSNINDRVTERFLDLINYFRSETSR